jgi:hypothetical protein
MSLRLLTHQPSTFLYKTPIQTHGKESRAGTEESNLLQSKCFHKEEEHTRQLHIRATNDKELHNKKIPALFIKLDISKAFDSVSSSHLLEIMTHLSFDMHRKNWISAI